MSVLSSTVNTRRSLSLLAAASVSALLLAGLPGCSGNKQSSAANAANAVNAESEAKTLAKLDDDWSAAAATKDANRVAAFYAEDAVAYPPNEPVAIGRAAARKVWAAYLSEPTFQISWKTTTAAVAQSGDIGFTAGTYQLSFKGPDGKTISEKGKYLCNWKKQKDGSWKATHDMWNSDSK